LGNHKGRANQIRVAGSMNNNIKWLPTALRNIGLYTFAIGIVNGANFLTAPLLVALLGKAEFARWGLLEPILLMGITLAGFGLQTGLMRKIRGDADRDRQAVQALLPFFVLSAAVVGVSSAIVVWSVGETPTVALLIGTAVLAEATMVFMATLWRCQDRAGLYVVFEAGRALAVILILVLVLRYLSFPFSDIENYLWLRALAAVVAMLGAIVVVRPGWQPNATEALAAFAYGGPIVIASLCAATLTSVDRYALAMWGNSAILAGYLAHVKVSQVLGSIVMPFYAWFAPKAIQWLEFDRQDRGFIERTTSIYFTCLVGICASLWLATPTIWPIIFPTIEFDRPLFAILLIGAAIYALGNPVSIGVLKPGKTYQAVVITLVSTIIGACACFAFAPILGSLGVSLGRGLGLLLYTLLFAINTTMALKISYQWGLFATVSAVVLGVCLAIERFIPKHDFLSLGMKLVFLGIAVLLLLYGTVRSTGRPLAKSADT
jgi:O-antigen/teichoic acid export membrane protein